MESGSIPAAPLTDVQPSTVAQKSPMDAVNSIYDALEPYDDATRQRILSSVQSLMGVAPSAPITAPLAAKRMLSPIELIQAKEPATNAQRIIVFAYYREKYEGQNYFARGDLEGYFAKAKQPAPGNYDRDFNEAVKQGWLYENGSESYLTGKGLEAVEAGFAGKGLPRGRFSKSATAKTRRKTASKAKGKASGKA
jgi:hypothetical protein